MLTMRNCKGCGKLYLSNGISSKCTFCEKSDDMEFVRIKNFLQTHPRANIYEVATNLVIKIDTIRMYLQQSRLEIIDSTNSFLACEKCKCSIKSGTLCDHCFRFANEKRTPIKYSQEYSSKSENYTQTDKNKELKIKFLTTPLAKSKRLATI